MSFNRVKRDYFCLVLKLLAYFEANVDIILIPLDGVILLSSCYRADSRREATSL